jgi:peptidoglycan/xylan/chitin deacetylase (PgdA/CDA1 family)
MLSWLYCAPQSPLGAPLVRLPMRAIALTFDDGPDPTWTPQVLERLAAHRVQASFFVLGDAIARTPDLLAHVSAAGHEVELHGARHIPALRQSPAALSRDLAATKATIMRLTGRAPRWYRPPYGIRPWRAHPYTALGLRLVTWSWDAGDWAGMGRRAPDAALAPLSPGAVLLLHDGASSDPQARARTLAVLDEVVALANRQQLPIGPIDRLLTRQPPPDEDPPYA